MELVYILIFVGVFAHVAFAQISISYNASVSVPSEVLHLFKYHVLAFILVESMEHINLVPVSKTVTLTEI